ncbi:MAG: hypothetical protein CMH52_01700 [Myxococcales bacterium]|nr:hypothetical protein [Myxococcales bacterium]
METDKTIINAKRCPTCGYRGEADICPFDGTGMVENIDLSQHLLESKPSVEPALYAPGADEADLSETSQADDSTAYVLDAGYDRANQLVGTTLGGRYVLKDVIGRGGMGTVYAAEQPSVDRTVAIKVLNQEFAENPMVVRRFHQEAQAASKLTHPNTISVYDFGETDGSLYIVMEHLVGETLKSLLKRTGRLTLNRTCLIVRQVLKSIAQAHAAGVIHRDLKPDNIFITRIGDGSEFVKVLDFGVAKLRKADDSDTTLTQMGAVFGTPKYMAPEQTQNIDLDGRSDLYSVGIILYELLLGTVPFDGENPLAILMDHANRAPASFEEIDPSHGYHPAVQSVVMKALEKNRDSRYRSVRDFLTDLDMLERSSRTDANESDQHALSQLIRVKDRKINSELDLSEELKTPERPAPSYRFPKSVLAGALAGAVLLALGLYYGQTQEETIQNAPLTDRSQVPISDDQQPASINLKSDLTAAVVAPKQEQRDPFVLDTVPPGAKLIDLNTGQRLGQTPKTIDVSKKSVIEARLEGYQKERFLVDPKDEVRRVKRTLVSLRPVPVSTRTKARTPKPRRGADTAAKKRVTKEPEAAAEIIKKTQVGRPHKSTSERQNDDIDFEME